MLQAQLFNNLTSTTAIMSVHNIEKMTDRHGKTLAKDVVKAALNRSNGEQHCQ